MINNEIENFLNNPNFFINNGFSNCGKCPLDHIDNGYCKSDYISNCSSTLIEFLKREGIAQERLKKVFFLMKKDFCGNIPCSFESRELFPLFVKKIKEIIYDNKLKLE